MPIRPRVTDDEQMPDIDRLLALTDGVVAIGATLLVLQLQIPASSTLKQDVNSASELWSALDVDVAELHQLSRLFVRHTAAVPGQSTTGSCESWRGHSEGLAWRNFAFLLAPTLTPFTADLMGRYSDNPLAVTFFGINLMALRLSTQWIHIYAARHNLIVDERRSRYEELVGRIRALLTVAVVSISLVLAWTDTSLARYVWLLFLVAPVIGSRIAERIESGRAASVSAET